MGKQRKKTSREHKAAVEIASKRRELSKLLKREGFDGIPLEKKPKSYRDDNAEKGAAEHPTPTQKSKEEREKERKMKLEERKRRAVSLLKRTRTGQPVMKNLIGDLVNKLSK